jgi:hypothetical protein
MTLLVIDTQVGITDDRLYKFQVVRVSKIKLKK